MVDTESGELLTVFHVVIVKAALAFIGTVIHLKQSTTAPELNMFNPT